MKTNIKFGMLQTLYQAESVDQETTEEVVNEAGEKEEIITTFTKYLPVTCSDEKCSALIRNNDECFVDSWSENGDVYCDSCGKCLRYARKKAAEREKLAAKAC